MKKLYYLKNLEGLNAEKATSRIKQKCPNTRNVCNFIFFSFFSRLL